MKETDKVYLMEPIQPDYEAPDYQIRKVFFSMKYCEEYLNNQDPKIVKNWFVIIGTRAEITTKTIFTIKE